MEEHDTPTIEITVLDSPHSDVQREDPDENIDPVNPVESPRGAPPTKRRPSWLQETLQQVEKHATPIGTFKQRKIP